MSEARDKLQEKFTSLKDAYIETTKVNAEIVFEDICEILGTYVVERDAEDNDEEDEGEECDCQRCRFEKMLEETACDEEADDWQESFEEMLDGISAIPTLIQSWVKCSRPRRRIK